MGKLATLTGFLLISLSLPAPCRAQDPQLPEGKGKELVDDVCGNCHGLDFVVAGRATKQEWSQTVATMISRGATGSDEDFKTIIEYLAKYFGKVNVNKAAAKEIESTLEIPAREAEAIVQYRRDHGDFKDWDSLSKVSGIDFKKLEDKKDRLSFN